jgi:hypothetical protein
MELPVYAKYCPSCGMQVHKPHVHHEMSATHTPQEEAHARVVDRLFEPAYQEIERRLEEPNIDKPELYDTVRRIEAEVLKGESANSDKLMRWLQLLQATAPDILALTMQALLKPDAGVTPAVRAQAERFSAEAMR